MTTSFPSDRMKTDPTHNTTVKLTSAYAMAYMDFVDTTAKMGLFKDAPEIVLAADAAVEHLLALGIAARRAGVALPTPTEDEHKAAAKVLHVTKLGALAKFVDNEIGAKTGEQSILKGMIEKLKAKIEAGQQEPEPNE